MFSAVGEETRLCTSFLWRASQGEINRCGPALRLPPGLSTAPTCPNLCAARPRAHAYHAGARHHEHFVSHPEAGRHRYADHARGFRRLGDRRAGLVRGLGSAGRRRVHPRHPPRGEPRHQLDRHRGRLRAGPFRKPGGPRAGRHAAFGAALCLHQGRPGGLARRPHGQAAPYRRPGQPAARGRGVVAQARRRSHRSVPDALAGRRRHAPRSVLASAARPAPGRQGAPRRPVQPQSGAGAGGRAAGPRRNAATAVLGHPPRKRRGPAALVRKPRHRRHRLQPHAVGPAVGRLQRRARRGLAGRRLARPQRRVHGAAAGGQSRVCRCAQADRAAPRRQRGRDCRRLGAGLARCHRRHCGRTQRRAGRWLAGRGDAGAGFR
ncbi:Uncharacterised protein [Bordetella pertussis]|nr:Uncharacterised protein [Bordetella pertussis]CFN06472.1 Uncharacterised protein [Bordetella pertussis]CFN43684.1 Uncharacterised protein [Bordetella pertussis]CFO45136.1 Uncharacterised protein [Bordetella pertussis]CFO79569.1 Uncharacterised protein [Bordetella pertussis]